MVTEASPAAYAHQETDPNYLIRAGLMIRSTISLFVILVSLPNPDPAGTYLAPNNSHYMGILRLRYTASTLDVVFWPFLRMEVGSVQLPLLAEDISLDPT
jgi:hypothetical protein